MLVALLGMRGLGPMYHSVNTLHFSNSIGGESEYLKPTEKALISEEVTILLKVCFLFQKFR